MKERDRPGTWGSGESVERVHPETTSSRGWTLAECLPTWLQALTAALFTDEERGLEMSNLSTEKSSGQDLNSLPPGGL